MSKKEWDDMRNLTFSDILFIVSLPYILLGYAVLCLLYAGLNYLSPLHDFKSGGSTT